MLAVDGTYDDVNRLCSELADKYPWAFVNINVRPFYADGSKTLGYEVAEQLGWHWPDWMIYPTGGGTGIIGMWKACDELETLGWVDRPRPRMVTVQAAGCAPIVRAYAAGTERAAPWENARTAADGLRVPSAIGDFLILRALRESGGTALAVHV